MFSNFDGVDTTVDYSTVKAAGPAASPLEFPTPTVVKGRRMRARALDHRTGRIYILNHILACDGINKPDRAYLIQKRIAKSVYGAVRQCVVLKRRREGENKFWKLSEEDDKEVEWISTDHTVAIKISSWYRVTKLRGRHLEDPIREISAMQLVGNYHPNLIGVIEVLQDSEYLYTVMPFCSGGDLFGRVLHDKSHTVDEARARLWFRQLVSGLFHLQRKGVCHRDISLDNIILDNDGNLVLVDFGMSLRIPFTDPSNVGCVTDVSEGSDRRLVNAQGQGGNLMYMAPEVVSRDEVFDGFALDLWAAGVVLFTILVGMAPFKWAHDSDQCYAQIAKGNMKELIELHNISLSAEACSLLQNMFWRDPRNRLTLGQIMQHPWLLGRQFSSPKNLSSTSSPIHRRTRGVASM
eukprot:CAMPEP_0194216480 /NCGR_PEP_ID=MMETSP0156-20130528/19058_1 /TAXON_ID=33649 /ORGANISM="Thalassionema nitzschioides, Strain L26-B" /LENGTH=407 /DNA_ID=CAMNT_0038945263 /DNA_START=170 /DNA_END=1393 /DNA_ORIENTATION=+